MSSLLSILVSATCLIVLAARDPKRIRNLVRDKPEASSNIEPWHPAMRRALAVLVLVPGVVLGIVHEWWSLLIWLGAVCLFGWIAAQLFAINEPSHGN